MPTQKAKKVTPPQDMDVHNEELRDDTRSTAEAESDAAAEARVLTTAEVAEQLETTPRTLRKFLRSKGSGVEPVGQGRRYALTEQSLPKLVDRFNKWSKVDDSEDDSEGADEAEAAVADADEELDEIEVEAYDADAEIEDDEFEEVEDDEVDLTELTVKELKQLAEDQGIEVAKKATKAKIIDALTS